MWVTRVDGEPEEEPNELTHLCKPCTLDGARKEFDEFVARVALQLTAEGAEIAAIRLETWPPV